MPSLGLRLSLKQVQECTVCLVGELASARRDEMDVVDPSDPDRYIYCVSCQAKVPYIVRRTKSYQRRWDEANAEILFAEVLYLREEIARLSGDEVSSTT
jgi:hypothetical protein